MTSDDPAAAPFPASSAATLRPSTPRPSTPRAVARGLGGTVLLGLGGLALGTQTRQAWLTVAAPGPAAPSDALLLVVGAVGTALICWLTLTLLLVLLAAVPGAVGTLARRWAVRLAPAAARHLAALLIGTTMTAVLTPAAVAAGVTPARPAAASAARSPEGFPGPAWRVTGTAGAAVGAGSAADRLPDPSWRPSRPAAPRHADVPAMHLLTPPVRAGQSVEEHAVVRRGDTLWSIAARHLGPSATAAEIAVEWPRWYAANRETIGPDPDLIIPGELLQPPTEGI